MAKEHTKAKLSEWWAQFYDRSAKAGEIVRQLAFAGIAVIWIFRTEATGTMGLSPELLTSLKLFIGTIICDLAHSFVPAVLYGSVALYNERIRRRGDDDLVHVPVAVTLPAWFFFFGKVILITMAYWHLYVHLRAQL